MYEWRWDSQRASGTVRGGFGDKPKSESATWVHVCALGLQSGFMGVRVRGGTGRN
jgi:hypothetical protein